MTAFSGKLSGRKGQQFLSIGNFDKCLAISNLETKFCKTYLDFDMRLANNITREIAAVHELFGKTSFVCVLKACSVDDLNTLTNDSILFVKNHCSANQKLKFDVLETTAM